MKSFFQTPDKDIIIMNYDGGDYEKMEFPNIVIHEEEAPEGYKLLPVQSAQTLIGDHVYHAIRDVFGLAVGLVNDGEKDLLAVLLENGTILFLTLPVISQNLPNDKLLTNVRNKLQQLFPEDAKRVAVNVGQGIVYIDGLVKNLAIKRALRGCVESIPKVRGCVDFMRVVSNSLVTDAVIESNILSILETPGIYVFDYNVGVSQGKVIISASCFDENYPKELETRVVEYPGVQELSFKLTSMPMYSMPNRSLCDELEHSFEDSSLMLGANVRVSFVRNKFLLEGRVTSNFQKQLAFFSTVKAVKSPSVENKLRVILK